MASVENEPVELTYLIVGIAILAILIGAILLEKDTFLGLLDSKISARRIQY